MKDVSKQRLQFWLDSQDWSPDAEIYRMSSHCHDGYAYLELHVRTPNEPDSMITIKRYLKPLT